jgi:hypothetical protein
VPPAPNTDAMSFARRRRTRVILGVVVALAVLVPLAIWFRTSSFVRVEHVRVTGIDGRQAAAVRGALTEAALDMTVLNVRPDELRAAVEPYPVVRSLRTETDFPHGLTITVNAYEPVGALKSGGDLTPVSGDGTLLLGSSARGLATVGVRATPVGGRIRDVQALNAIHVLASAPPALRRRVAHVYRAWPRSGARQRRCSPTAPPRARRTSICACPNGPSPGDYSREPLSLNLNYRLMAGCRRFSCTGRESRLLQSFLRE